MSNGEGTDAFLRAFIGVEAGDAVRRGLVDVLHRLRKTGAHVSWVPEQNIHVSLAFLGNTSRERVAPLSHALDEVAAAAAPFAVCVSGIGTFGSPRSPRVVWAGVEDSPPLQALHAAVCEQLELLDLPVEKRRYSPHLTLGRVRSGRGRPELVKALQACRDAVFGTMTVERVVLMQSRLLPQGAQYSVLHAAEFRAGV